jgi:hypothetical protein
MVQQCKRQACGWWLFWVWAFYASVMTWAWQGFRAVGVPDAASWAVGLLLGFWVLIWTREI